MTIATLILDCDGVLVDSEPLSNRALAQALTALGVPSTPQEATARYKGRSWASVEADVARRAPDLALDGLAADYRERMFAAFATELRPVPGVVAALDAIELPTCVASSGDHDKLAFTLGHTGLLERFAGRIFSTTEVSRGKPAPDLFLHAAAAMGWEPASTGVVEDSPVGVEAAVAAGMTALGYARETDAEVLASAGASAVFSDMAELPSLLSPRGV
jgi:HAD superfamily hydrolase (TIGR01509 family)